MKKHITLLLIILLFNLTSLTVNASNIGTIVDRPEPQLYNNLDALVVPTYITNINGTWFVVDCYHDRVLYNKNINEHICNWWILTMDVNKPHTIAGDGEVYLVDDTDNNRVLVFKETENGFVNTQIFENIGNRPHHTIYDIETGRFYVWSSLSAEMFIFENKGGVVELTNTFKVDMVEGTYIRSFYIDGSDLYLVSGLRGDYTATNIIKCEKYQMMVQEVIEVPNELAGMASMRKDANNWYITISTDNESNQNAATMIMVDDLHKLVEHEYTDIYSNFIGGGTPYNTNKVGDYIYLTEHRIPGYYIWRYQVDEYGKVKNISKVF